MSGLVNSEKIAHLTRVTFSQPYISTTFIASIALISMAYLLLYVISIETFDQLGCRMRLSDWIRFLFLLSIAFCFSFAVASDEERDAVRFAVDSDCKKAQLHGKVSIVVTRTEDVSAKKPAVIRSIEKFNQQGMLTQRTRHDHNGEVSCTWKYFYNCKGSLELKKQFGTYGNALSKSMYTYNPEKRQCEKRVYGKKNKLNSKSILKYNAKSQLTERSSFAPNGNREYSLYYSYDTKGNLIYRGSRPMHKDDNQTFEYKYDKSGCLVEKREHYYDMGQLAICITKYDKNRNVKEVINSPISSAAWKSKLNYYLDEKGNWITASNFIWQGEDIYDLSNITHREISYFKE